MMLTRWIKSIAFRRLDFFSFISTELFLILVKNTNGAILLTLETERRACISRSPGLLFYLLLSSVRMNGQKNPLFNYFTLILQTIIKVFAQNNMRANAPLAEWTTSMHVQVGGTYFYFSFLLARVLCGSQASHRLLFICFSIGGV